MGNAVSPSMMRSLTCVLMATLGLAGAGDAQQVSPVAPSDPSIVWAGTGEPHIRSNVSLGTGVYRFTDAGRTWCHMRLGEGGPTRMSRIVVHPHDPDIVYVGALGHAHGPQRARGVFRTA